MTLRALIKLLTALPDEDKDVEIACDVSLERIKIVSAKGAVQADAGATITADKDEKE